MLENKIMTCLRLLQLLQLCLTRMNFEGTTTPIQKKKGRCRKMRIYCIIVTYIVHSSKENASTASDVILISRRNESVLAERRTYPAVQIFLD
jgi:hypothetical protein